jgi:hypothetical protein
MAIAGPVVTLRAVKIVHTLAWALCAAGILFTLLMWRIS